MNETRPAPTTLASMGWERRPERLRPVDAIRADHLDLRDDVFWTIFAEVFPVTELNVATLWNLYDSVGHVLRRGLAGAFVECGVLLGGSTMALLRTLQHHGASDREVAIYDSFRLFTGPASEHDVAFIGRRVEGTLPDFEDVTRANIALVGFPTERLKIHKGNVEEVLSATAPDIVAWARLDTDTYHSTRVELEVLWPRLVPGGLLIVDDYGYAHGARLAVEEYFAARGETPFLARISHGCRVLVKEGTREDRVRGRVRAAPTPA